MMKSERIYQTDNIKVKKERNLTNGNANKMEAQASEVTNGEERISPILIQCASKFLFFSTFKWFLFSFFVCPVYYARSVVSTLWALRIRISCIPFFSLSIIQFFPSHLAIWLPCISASSFLFTFWNCIWIYAPSHLSIEYHFSLISYKKKVNFICQINQIDGMALCAIFFLEETKRKSIKYFKEKRAVESTRLTLMAPPWKRYSSSKEIKTICHFQMQRHIMLLLFFIWVVNWGVHNVLAYEIWCAWEFLPWYNTSWHTHARFSSRMQLNLRLCSCYDALLFNYPLICWFINFRQICATVAVLLLQLLNCLHWWFFIHQLSKWCFKWANKMNYKIFHPIFSPMAMLCFSFFHCGLRIFFSFIR